MENNAFIVKMVSIFLWNLLNQGFERSKSKKIEDLSKSQKDLLQVLRFF